MAIQIRTLKLAFIYTQTVSGPILGQLPGAAAMPFLGNRADYANKYDEIRQKYKQLQKEIDALPGSSQRRELRLKRQHELSLSGGLGPPWPWLFLTDNYLHHFWQYYFENRPPNEVSGQALWGFVTPLELYQPVMLQPTQAIAGVKLDVGAQSFVYPHGVAVIIHATLRFMPDNAVPGSSGGADLQSMMNDVMDLRWRMAFETKVGDQSYGSLKLEGLSQRLLRAAREQAFGPDVDAEPDTGRPLTVATVLKGSGVDATLPVAPQGLLHLALESLCDWNDSWDSRNRAELTELDKADLLKDHSIKGHIVYHAKRGRAAWMPAYFRPSGNTKTQKLSCYHRNTTLVLMQTDMLLKAVLLYRNHNPAPDALTDLAKQAAVRLGYLYGSTVDEQGRKFTYNSATPRAYVDDNGYTKAANEACTRLNSPSLAYTPH